MPFFAILGVLARLFASDPVLAQREPGATGIGLQVGRPSGVAVKVYQSGGVAYDGILTTDTDQFVAARFHRVWESPLPDSPLHLYFGPGIALGTEGLDQTPRIRFGWSTEAGLNFYSERFEVFLHVTPSVHFIPERKAYLDGNVGLRYYLRSP